MARPTQTRDRLVQTAGELFWRQGYAHTGVSEIMKRAKATSGSFYHFFPTKDHLLLAVLDEVQRWIETDVFEPVEALSPDPGRRVSALAEVYNTHAVSRAEGFGLPLGALVNELGPDHEMVRRRIAEIYQVVIDRVSLWFARPNRSGSGSAEQRAMAEFVVDALEGSALVAAASRSPDVIDACARQLRLHIDGVAGAGGTTDEQQPPPMTDGEVGDWKAW